jgi:hypothetical protein
MEDAAHLTVEVMRRSKGIPQITGNVPNAYHGVSAVTSAIRRIDMALPARSRAI